MRRSQLSCCEIRIHGKLCLWQVPENRTPRESNAPHPHLLCAVRKRKLSLDVRDERNLSHSFNPNQLHSSPILLYRMTSAAILCHSFPHKQADSVGYILFLWLKQTHFIHRSTLRTSNVKTMRCTKEH